MAHQSSLKPSGVSRRVWLLAPIGIGAGALWYLGRTTPLPAASENGGGEIVSITLFSDTGERLQTIHTRKLIKSPDEWRKQLGSESFAVTRRQSTEFPYHNQYWDNHKEGLYRCICCGNAIFSSKDKFDSDTGWPSFTAPVAQENIATKTDRTFLMERTEVLCRKCDAHLGHLFDDGPPPDHNRFCLNSAALRFFEVA